MPTTDAVRPAGVIPAGEWSVDAERSSVAFTLKHLLFTKVRGNFHEFEGSLSVGEGAIEAGGVVSAASLDTQDAVRDEHVRSSPDFFDVEHHPEIGFASTRIEDLGDGGVRITGNLQVRGVTSEIQLEGTGRPCASPDGEPERIELLLAGEVDRRDFGLTWNQKLDTGGAMLGNRVKIELEIVAARSSSV
jgi:polyisoprenoid-binding protein YceI